MQRIFRSSTGLLVVLSLDPDFRRVQLVTGDGTRLTFTDDAADAVASEVMHTRGVAALDVTFPRDTAFRLARALRKAAVPEAAFSQEWWPYGDTERAYARAEVVRFGRAGEARRPMPRTGRETVALVRRAAREALRVEGDVDALHDRVNHRTGEDRRIEAAWLRERRGWTLEDVLEGRHLPF